jgi:hypothetical protein
VVFGGQLPGGAGPAAAERAELVLLRDVPGGDGRPLWIAQVRRVQDRRECFREHKVGLLVAAFVEAGECPPQRQPALPFSDPAKPARFGFAWIDLIVSAFPLDD